MNPIEDRYSRIDSLVDNKALKSSRVVVFGSGGRMGAPVVEQFVRHGAGTASDGGIVLVDGDVVSEPNLAYYYNEAHVGMNKVDAQAQILKAINSKVNLAMMATQMDKSREAFVMKLATTANLICWFIDDPPLYPFMDRVHLMCNQVWAAFGRRSDFGEIGFSIPYLTVPLTRMIGNRERARIDGAQALGVDTTYIANFVASVCLRLLLAGKKGSELIPCYYNAPLFAVGVRRGWIFSDLPDEVVRCVYAVGVRP